MTTPIRHGTAMISAMVVILTLTALAVGLTNITVSAFGDQMRRRDATQVFLAAESAANEAYQRFQNGYRSLVVDDLPDVGDEWVVPLDGMVNNCQRVAVIRRITASPSDRFLITATAISGDPSHPETFRRIRVETMVRTYPFRVFKQALFALEGYDFTGSAATHSWSSNEGAYNPALETNNGDLGSEGDIAVGGSASVSGEVNANQEFPLPVVTYNPPGTAISLPLGAGAPGLVNSSIVLGTPGEQSVYRAAEIDLEGGESLTIRGRVTLYVDGAMLLKQATIDYPAAAVVASASAVDGALILAPGTDFSNFVVDDRIDVVGSGPNAGKRFTIQVVDAATRTLRVSEAVLDSPGGEEALPDAGLLIYQNEYDEAATAVSQFNINGNTHVGNNERPDRLIFVTLNEGEMRLNGNGSFGGVFFGPKVTMNMNGTFQFYGSMIAASFAGRVNGTFDFHYDDSLADLDLDLEPRLGVIGWRSFPLAFAQE